MLCENPAWHSLRHGAQEFCRRYLTAQVTSDVLLVGACRGKRDHAAPAYAVSQPPPAPCPSADVCLQAQIHGFWSRVLRITSMREWPPTKKLIGTKVSSACELSLEFARPVFLG